MRLSINIQRLRKGMFMLLFTMMSALLAVGQEDANTLGEPMPEFTLYQIGDSSEFKSTTIKKKGILLIKIFSPDCEHCQEEAKKYVALKDSLKNIRTVWVATPWSKMETIEAFAEDYDLAQLNPLAIGKENGFLLQKHFKVKGFPFAALYIHDQLVIAQQGALDFEELIAIANGVYD